MTTSFKIYDCRIMVIFIFSILIGKLNAQSSLPVIKADSKIVDVIDGDNLKEGWWVTMPERKLDRYYVSIPHKPHRVTFRTDMDTIGFDTRYGETYDFIIALKNGDSCHTRIIAKEKELLSFSRPRRSEGLTSDTIPITVGDNSKIYIKGSINGSSPLNFQFDLGAGGSIIKKGSIDKVRMDFDGTTFLINSDGRNEVPISSRNTLKVGSMTWKGNITLVVGDNMSRGEDGLLGNGLFLDKVIEIDYDKKIMVIHDSLPDVPSGYEKQSFILDGVIPYIRASIIIAEETFTDWYMFDTGYSGILRIGKSLGEKYRLDDKTRTTFNPFKKTFILPNYKVGNHSFKGLRAVVHPGVGKNTAGILGNELLKRYNLILDNRNGAIYLRPNHLMDAPFDRPLSFYIILLALIPIMVLVLVWWARKRKKS